MNKIKKDIIIIGSGPGGYTAAFHLADHGRHVLLIEKEDLGGVCLNRGCIPSKALLNIAKHIDKSKKLKEYGIEYQSSPKINLPSMKKWKNNIVLKLRNGIKSLASARKVEIIQGKALFDDATTIRVETKTGQTFYSFNDLIIATGSTPFIPSSMDLGNPRIMTSTDALNIDDIPKDLLVVGGGYIGMELGSVYASLGSNVSIVEALDEILFTADTDLIKIFQKHVLKKFKHIYLSHTVKKMATKGKKINVGILTSDNKSLNLNFDKVLVSVGRTPNSTNLGLENTSIKTDEKGFIIIDDQCKTSEPSIYAIGDVVGGVQLAHKATKEAKIVSETILGNPTLQLKEFVIPAVVFTDPEISWVGITEKEAKEQKLNVSVSKFPWSANGRALTLDRTEGLTKIISDSDTDQILGIGIVGEHAGDLISEAAIAIQTGLTITDLAETIHPHPTLSETLMEAAEKKLGTCTHLLP